MTARHKDESQAKRNERSNKIPLVLKVAWIVVPIAQILFAASPISTDFGYVVFGTPLIFLVWIVSRRTLTYLASSRWTRIG
jgi:hypothetical protein